MRKLIIVLILILFLLLPAYSSKAEIKSVKRVVFDTQGLPNPFRSLLPEKRIEEKIELVKIEEPEISVPPPEVDIQGIVWGGPFPQAIIDNQVIREGDVLGEYEPITILEIKPQEIVVLFKKKLFTYHP